MRRGKPVEQELEVLEVPQMQLGKDQEKSNFFPSIHLEINQQFSF